MRITNDTRGSVPVMAPTRFRNMGVIIPDVVRPALLTDTLRGCGCGGGCGVAGPDVGGGSGMDGMRGGRYLTGADIGGGFGMDGMRGGGRYRNVSGPDVGGGFGMDGMRGVRGLGQLDPGSLTLEINTMVASARAFWDSLVKTLGIGAGRREADVITPMQNKITATILAPAVEMGTHPQIHTCDDFRKMLGVIQQARVEFKSFLTNSQWQDGRAAAQALVWLEGPLPASASGAWFHQVESDFGGEVMKKCGVGGGGAIPPGGQVTGPSALSLPVILGAALLLLPSLKKLGL